MHGTLKVRIQAVWQYSITARTPGWRRMCGSKDCISRDLRFSGLLAFFHLLIYHGPALFGLVSGIRIQRKHKVRARGKQSSHDVEQLLGEWFESRTPRKRHRASRCATPWRSGPRAQSPTATDTLLGHISTRDRTVDHVWLCRLHILRPVPEISLRGHVV